MFPRFKILVILFLVILIFFLVYLFFGCSSSGCRSYNSGKYLQAYESFRSIQNTNAIFNAGNAKFRIAEDFEISGNRELAYESYEESLKLYKEVQRNDSGKDVVHNIEVVQNRLQQIPSPKTVPQNQKNTESSGTISQKNASGSEISGPQESVKSGLSGESGGVGKQEIAAPEKFFIESGEMRQLSAEEVSEAFKNIEEFHKKMLEYLNQDFR